MAGRNRNPLLVVVVLVALVGGLRVCGGLIAGVVVLLVILLLWLLDMHMLNLVLLGLHLVVGGVGRSSVSRGHIGGGRRGIGFDHGSWGGRGVVILDGSSGHHLVVDMGQGLAVDDGIESVHRVGSVLDGATEAIGIVQRVLALDHIPVAGLNLALGVPGQSVLDIVGEVVLGMRIVGVHLVAVGMDLVLLLVDHMLRLVGLVELRLVLVLLQRDDASGGGCQAAGNQSNQLEKIEFLESIKRVAKGAGYYISRGLP